MLRRPFVFLFLILGLSGISSTYAEEIRIPIGQQSQESSIAVPRTGMKKAEVEKRFGMPLEQTAPVGSPPISRWVYADFVVYFEYDHVIRSVKTFKRSDSEPQ